MEYLPTMHKDQIQYPGPEIQNIGFLILERYLSKEEN